MQRKPLAEGRFVFVMHCIRMESEKGVQRTCIIPSVVYEITGKCESKTNFTKRIYANNGTGTYLG